VKGVTVVVRDFELRVAISIHTPVKGVTAEKLIRVPFFVFQSTHP